MPDNLLLLWYFDTLIISKCDQYVLMLPAFSVRKRVDMQTDLITYILLRVCICQELSQLYPGSVGGCRLLCLGLFCCVPGEVLGCLQLYGRLIYVSYVALRLYIGCEGLPAPHTNYLATSPRARSQMLV